MDHARRCLRGTKSRPWEARLGGREAGGAAGSSVLCLRVSTEPSVGKDNPPSGLCKANPTPTKLTLPALHTFRGKEGLCLELPKRCLLERTVHCRPANLRDSKESLTVQTLHTGSEQRCKKSVPRVPFGVLVLEHEARAVTTAEHQAGTKVGPTPLPALAFCCRARAGIKPSGPGDKRASPQQSRGNSVSGIQPPKFDNS